MPPSHRVLEGRRLTYRYPQTDRPAVDAVDIVVQPGRRIALVGANGSGKSTLLLLLKGLLVPSDGEVSIDGRQPSYVAAKDDIPPHLGVGLVFQNPDNQIVAALVDEDVAFGPENLGVAGDELSDRVHAALEVVGLESFARREPHSLSGGEKQRLAIAGALALKPGYLLLDEATSMLDPDGRAQVRGVLAALHAEGSIGILEVTHDLAEALDADEVVLLSEGRVVAEGSPREVIGDAKTLIAAGLVPLPATRLAGRLNGAGLAVPADALTAEEVLAAL